MNRFQGNVVKLVAGIGCLLWVADASAQEQERRRPPEQANVGPQIGARIGYAAGSGSVYSGLPVSDTANGAIPVLVDLGWRFLPELYVGLYGQFASVLVKNHPIACPDGFSCSAQDWRFGAQADFHFMPRIRLDPYLGIGAGYEVLHQSQSGSLGGVAVDASVTERGWEFGSLTAGFDWRVNNVLGIGPFVSGSVGVYDTQSGTFTLNGMPAPLPNGDHTAHEIILAGARGTINP